MSNLNDKERHCPPKMSSFERWKMAVRWTIYVLVVLEIFVRPVVATYWPTVPLPPTSAESIANFSKLIVKFWGGI